MTKTERQAVFFGLTMYVHCESKKIPYILIYILAVYVFVADRYNCFTEITVIWQTNWTTKYSLKACLNRPTLLTNRTVNVNTKYLYCK